MEPQPEATNPPAPGAADDAPALPARTPSVELIMRTLTDAVFRTRGITPGGRLARLLEPLVGKPLQRFVTIFDEFDRICAATNFIEAARALLPVFASGVEVIGADYVPREGPVLLVSNHPGNFDELVISAALRRSDLRIFANAYPILTEFPNISRHAVFSRESDPQARMNALRNGIRQLRMGRLLVIFPTGQTDPDPRITDGARESLLTWSQSMELFVNKAPETQVVVTMVSGVSSPTVLRTPPMLFRRPAIERQKLGGSVQMALQVLFPRLFNLVPRVSFSAPLTLQEMTREGGGIRESIIRQAERFIEVHRVQTPVVPPLALRA